MDQQVALWLDSKFQGTESLSLVPISSCRRLRSCVSGPSFEGKGVASRYPGKFFFECQRQCEGETFHLPTNLIGQGDSDLLSRSSFLH